MTIFHHLPPALFDRIAGGGGGPDVIRRLHAVQISKHRLLIGHLLARWPGDVTGRDEVAEALERVRLAAPDTFREVIGAPLVGAWTAITTRAVMYNRAVPADFMHLGAIAVTACAAAGLDGSAEVPVHDGSAVLPGLGAADLAHDTMAVAESRDGRITVRGAGPRGGTEVAVPADPTAEAPGWRPVRRLRAAAAGRALDVSLDDLHPYRHGHHVPPALRLPDAEVTAWQRVFRESWTLLAERLPERADELTAGLRTLIPLQQADPRSARSATIRHAFGVFGLTRPPSAAEFAVTMVHEFQHSKLSALFDLVPLIDPDDTGRYFAPWRTDPRPLSGLVQGVYAFTGVADTWRALRTAHPSAEFRFAEARLQVDRGLTAMERSGALTSEGAKFAAGLRRTVDVMLAEPVRPEVARTARNALEQTRRAWMTRNDMAG